VSDRLRELAERQARLQERCAAQRASIASEVASIEARFGNIDRIVGFARRALLNPIVIVGGIVVLWTIGRSRGMRLVGRLYLLTTAARRLLQTVRVFQRLAFKPSPAVRREEL
jgi:hypothetical protein